MVKNRKLNLFCLSTVVLGLFMQAMYVIGPYSFKEIFNMIYGYVNFEDYSSLMITLIKWILPQLLLVCFWGDYLEENLMSHLNYILTRTNKPGKYLAAVYLKLFVFVLLECILLYVITATMTVIHTGRLDLEIGTIENMLLYCVYLFLSLILVNVLSIFIKAAYAAAFIIGIQVIFFELTKLIFDGLLAAQIYPLLPTSKVLFYYQKTGSAGILGLLFLLAALLIIYALNVIFLKKKEII